MSRRTHRGEWAVAGWIVALALWFAGPARAQPSTRLAIEDVSHAYQPGVLETYLRGELPPPLLDALAADHNVFWVLTYHGEILSSHTNYCWVAVGVTEQPPRGRNARVPHVMATGMGRSRILGALDRAQLDDCTNTALHSAVETFAAASLASVLEDVAKTRERGGKRAPAPAAPDKVAMYSRGLSVAGKQRVMAAIPGEFRRAFDYRRLEWVVLTYEGEIDDASVCFAVVGVSGSSPDDRNSRLPGHRTMKMRQILDAPDHQEARQRCKDELALDLVTEVLEDSWDARGLLSDFSFAQEAAVPPVTGYRRKDPQVERAALLAKFRGGLKIGGDTHCGLVTEVKGPIVRVQSAIGEVWLKATQLYPEGARDCRFLNGVYQDAE